MRGDRNVNTDTPPMTILYLFQKQLKTFERKFYITIKIQMFLLHLPGFVRANSKDIYLYICDFTRIFINKLHVLLFTMYLYKLYKQIYMCNIYIHVYSSCSQG